MKISKSRSWHYKLYRYITNVLRGPRYLNPWANVGRIDTTPPESLCPYTWSIAFGLLGVTGIAILALAISPIIAVVFVLYHAARIVGRSFIRLLDRMDEWNSKKSSTPRTKKPRSGEPGIVFSYIKARKQKICPPIELVD